MKTDVINDPRVQDQEWARREGLVAFVGYPLLAEGALIGVMALFFRRALSAATFDALEHFADRLGLGIYRQMACWRSIRG